MTLSKHLLNEWSHHIFKYKCYISWAYRTQHLSNKRAVIMGQGLGSVLGKRHSYRNSLIVYLSWKGYLQGYLHVLDDTPSQSWLTLNLGVPALVKRRWPCHHWAGKAKWQERVVFGSRVFGFFGKIWIWMSSVNLHSPFWHPMPLLIVQSSHVYLIFWSLKTSDLWPLP